MPKEPKKFINPLLRPSSVIDRNEQVEEKVAPKNPPETTASSSPSSSEPVASITNEENNASEGRITEQVSTAPVRPGVKRASHSRPVNESKEVAPPAQETPKPVIPDTSTSLNTYTYTEENERHQREAAPVSQEEKATTSHHSKTQSSGRETLANVVKSSAQTVPLYSDQIESQKQVEPSPQRARDEYRMLPQRQAPNDEDNFFVEATTASQPVPIIPGQYTSDLLDASAFSAQGAVRRRRGAQTFERTHERITLWIDKRLKQAFDDLANDRELPKTALLNEAIADLLRKYRS